MPVPDSEQSQDTAHEIEPSQPKKYSLSDTIDANRRASVDEDDTEYEDQPKDYEDTANARRDTRTPH